jgi:hypothetical protein
MLDITGGSVFGYSRDSRNQKVKLRLVIDIMSNLSENLSGLFHTSNMQSN